MSLIPAEARPPFDAAVGVADLDGAVATEGPETRRFPLASVTKLLTGYTILTLVAEGTTDLGAPAGPEGSTLRHLLAHASGLAPDSDRTLAAPGTRRIYSNRGIELAAAHVEHDAGAPFAELVRRRVLAPLGMDDTAVTGSPAHGASSTVSDLLALGWEFLAPTLVPRELFRDATSTVFPGLPGVLPGYGAQRPNDWGLAFELRHGKHPHWTPPSCSASTFGHFGQSGSYLFVDPAAGRTGAFLGSEPFGPAHVELWPAIGEALLDAPLAG